MSLSLEPGSVSRSILSPKQPTTASRPYPSSPTQSNAPQSPEPARWSLTNRVFNFTFRPSVPRAPAARLWNPINSSPRAPPPAHSVPNIPVSHPQITEGPPRLTEGRDSYPLLTLSEQRRSKQSLPGSLTVEPSAGGGSGRTSVGLPSNRRSLAPEDTQQQEQAESSAMAQAVARAAGVADPPAVPKESKPDDLEAGQPKLKHSSSRASLPLSASTSGGAPGRTASGDNNNNAREEAGEEEEEIPWGPSHPCFPHPNPHVPLSSPLYETTRIIRIKRDWMVAGDLAPAFTNVYPEVLDPLMTEEQFRAVVARVNRELVAAFSPWSARAWADALLGVATLWLWDDLSLAGVKKRVDAVERWIGEWNEEVGRKEGVEIISLRRTGFLSMDIQIPDPHIGLDTDATSRPVTRNMEGPNPAGPEPQWHGEYGPYPVQDLRALRQEGHQHLPRGVAVEGR